MMHDVCDVGRMIMSFMHTVAVVTTSWIVEYVLYLYLGVYCAIL